MNAKHVIIIGKGEGWEEAPEEGELWGVNDVVLRRPVTRIFDIHDLTIDKEAMRLDMPGDTSEYELDMAYTLRNATLATARQHNIPLYTIREIPGIPTSIRYPIERVMAYFDTDYFSCTIDYMIAYGLAMKAKRLDLYGVNFVTTREHSMQRPCTEYWIGRARERGAEVHVYGTKSALGTTKGNVVYGYNWERPAKRIPRSAFEEIFLKETVSRL